jgi:hypothetical protein
MSESLPNQIARCNGERLGMSDGAMPMSCIQCQRRTSERTALTHTMQPPEKLNGRCPARIEPR